MDEQKGNYSAVPHEMAAVLMRLDLTARENRIVWFLIREIIGYQLKEKVIKMNRFIEGTGLYRQNIYTAIFALIKKQVIFRDEVKGDRGEYLYRFNEEMFGRVHATSHVRVDAKTKVRKELSSHQVNDSDVTEVVTSNPGSELTDVIKSMTSMSSSRLHQCHQVNDINVIKSMTSNPWDAAPSAATLAPKDSIKDIKNILKIETKKDFNSQVNPEIQKLQRDWLLATNGDIPFEKWNS